MKTEHLELQIIRYTWKFEKKGAFRKFDMMSMFPYMLNQFLSAATAKELDLLRDGQHYLRMYAYDNDTDESFFNMCVLNIDGCNSERYKELLRSGFKPCFPVPEFFYLPFPCEINIGPFWYFFKINRHVLQKKKAVPADLWMVGRDALPYETEEDILKNELEDEIFILRNNN